MNKLFTDNNLRHVDVIIISFKQSNHHEKAPKNFFLVKKTEEMMKICCHYKDIQI